MKKNILLVVLILSVCVGIYSLAEVIISGNNFEEGFKEFGKQTELTVELEEGEYDLFELSTSNDEEEEFEIDYLVNERGDHPKVIEIALDTKGVAMSKGTKVTYTLYGKRFRSIGFFEIDKKQPVRFVSDVADIRVDKLAYRAKVQKDTIWGVMGFSLLLVACVGGILISGISLIVLRVRRKRSAREDNIHIEKA